MEIRLYRKNALGIGTWRIWDDDGVLFYAHATVMGGSEVVHYDAIELNKSGRTLQQQIELEMNSRVSRMRDKGYKDTVREAELGATNQLNFLNPMLAQSLSKVRANFDFAYVQPKLDGHRCLITNADGDIIAYSRRGKPIKSIPHIVDAFKWLPPSKTVDGELYHHGTNLQTIGSWIKRDQPESAKLKYHWYDYVSNLPFALRIDAMGRAFSKYPSTYVEVVETVPVRNISEVYEAFDHYRKIGYEGAMLRLSTAGYQPNVRAAQLLKVKAREDCEVTVTGATPSKDGWAVLHVRMDNGVEFDTSAPGSVEQKTEVMVNIDKYVGKRLTIEYANLTDDGKPFHAVATRWREDV
jgi:DNA ligase-1